MRKIITTIRSTIRNSAVLQRIIGYFGLESAAISAYRYFLNTVTSDIQEKSIGGSTVEFHTETTEETHSFFQPMENERPVIREILETISAEDTFWDVGAHIGGYTCFVSSILPAAQVYAFEPHPGNVSRLRQNLDLNGTDATIYDIALGDESGTRQLALGGEEVGVSSHSLLSNDENNTREIDIRRGDDLIEENGIPPPTVLKIDVEGAEIQVLEGLKETISKDSCELLYCEVHPDYIGTSGETELKRILTEAGFTVERIHTRGREYFLRGEKPTDR